MKKILFRASVVFVMCCMLANFLSVAEAAQSGQRATPVNMTTVRQLQQRSRRVTETNCQGDPYRYACKCYDNGQYSEALKWFKIAAEKGNKTAKEFVGFMYQEGKGTAQNYSEAVKWYKSAEAMDRLGYMYEKGLGVEQNYKEAARLYEVATRLALSGRAKAYASVRLGELYEQGLGVEQDYKKAEYYYWWGSLSDAGSCYGGIACIKLGRLYEQRSDVDGAIREYRKASERGAKEEAEKMLNRLLQ